jgi:hypothetical protein
LVPLAAHNANKPSPYLSNGPTVVIIHFVYCTIETKVSGLNESAIKTNIYMKYLHNNKNLHIKISY